MSDDIKPALTADEWAKELDYPVMDAALNHAARSLEVRTFSAWHDKRHALAALCLYQQPFGFTQDEMATLRAVAAPFELHHDDDISPGSGHELIDFATFPVGTQAQLLSAAAKIAALLPPEETP